MNGLVRLSLLVALAISGGAACNAAEPQDAGEAEVDEQEAFAEIPARSARVPGATMWRFTLDPHGGRATAVNDAGETLIELSMGLTRDTTTIEDVATGERMVIARDGTVLEISIRHGSLVAEALVGLSEDVEAFKAENPDRPQDCTWEFISMWVQCTAMVAVCTHPLVSWVGCGAMALPCADAAGDFYTECFGG